MQAMSDEKEELLGQLAETKLDAEAAHRQLEAFLADQEEEDKKNAAKDEAYDEMKLKLERYESEKVPPKMLLLWLC